MRSPTSRNLALLAACFIVLGASVRTAAEEAEEARALPGYGWIGVDGVDVFDAACRDPDRLAALGDAKGILVRTRPMAWGRMQPRAPIHGRSLRDFSEVDAFVAAWQRAGAELILVISPDAPWAASSQDTSDWAEAVREHVAAHERDLWLAQGTGAAPPRAAYWAEWQRFIQDLVERYDADGEADAPGVTRPVRWIQILDRPSSPRSWTGSAAEYQRVLHHATLGAELASRRVQVAAGAVDLGRDAYPPSPDEEELRRRFRARQLGRPAAVSFAETRALDFDFELLGIPGLYAAVSQVGRTNLRDERQGPAALRLALDAQGVRAEIWLVDSPLAKTDDPERDPTGRMSDAERRTRARWLAAVRTPGLQDYEKARAWFEHGRACDVIRTAVTARAAGVDRLVLGGDRGLDAWVPGTKEGGWKARPCVPALVQVVALLSGHTRATTTSLGRAATATRFEFPRGHEQPYIVAVALDPRHSWAGSLDGSSDTWAAAVPLPRGRYVMATMNAQGAFDAQTVRVEGGLLPLALGPEPVFLWPDL